MMTWQIMIGAQLISMLVSAGVILEFVMKKEPLDKSVEKNDISKKDLIKHAAA